MHNFGTKLVFTKRIYFEVLNVPCAYLTLLRLLSTRKNYISDQKLFFCVLICDQNSLEYQIHIYLTLQRSTKTFVVSQNLHSHLRLSLESRVLTSALEMSSEIEVKDCASFMPSWHALSRHKNISGT